MLGANVVLCDFCRADFWSYKPSYFGRGREYQPGKDMVFMRAIFDPKPTKDKYCPECKRRLAFLRFLAEVRDGAER